MKIPEIAKICLDSTFHKISITETVDKLNKIDRDTFAEFIMDLFSGRYELYEDLFDPDPKCLAMDHNNCFNEPMFINFNKPPIYSFIEKDKQLICNFCAYLRCGTFIDHSIIIDLVEGYVDFQYNLGNGKLTITATDLKLNKVTVNLIDVSGKYKKVSSNNQYLKEQMQKYIQIIFDTFCQNLYIEPIEVKLQF